MVNRIIRGQLAALIIGAALGGASARAGDWPMWGHGSGRGGTSPDPLPAQVSLQWIRQLPEPRPAWPASQKNLQFDATHQVISAEGRLFVGSSSDDSITAYETATGKELWCFFTDGPVRFAPAAGKDGLYAVSDDGHLYCLDPATGKLRWKVRGGPSDRRILGNERLVSTWPARGGPVLADGVVYFTAGIWPSMGIFVHAVDAASGRVLWTNSETGSLFTVHPHGAQAFGSICPQGYLAVSGDYLVVPGGRTYPAVFHRHTGRFLHFDFGSKGGGSWAVRASGEHYFLGGERIQLADGKRSGKAPAQLLPPGLTLAEGSSDTLTIQSTAGKTTTRKVGTPPRTVRTEIRFEPDFSLTVQLEAGQPTRPLLMAGSRVYTAEGGKMAAFDLPLPGKGEDAPARPPTLKAVWQAAVEGNVTSMVAADDRLFVVTDEHRLYCFGEGRGEPVTHALSPRSLPATQDAWTGEARDLLEQTGVDAGYALVWGIGSGRAIEELLRQSRLHVVVLDPDEDAVSSLRQRMREAGLYGTRVTAHVGTPQSVTLPLYLASLAISETGSSLGLPASLKDFFRPLRPYGGAAWLKLSADEHRAVEAGLSGAGLAGAKLSRQGAWTILARAGALPGAGAWTHQNGNEGNTCVSSETLARAPLGVLWFGGPPNDDILPRHGHGPAPQVAGGRLVIEGPDMLRAVDVYTGRLLWQRDLPGVGDYYNTTRHFAGAGSTGGNYVTLPDSVYVIHQGHILELDAATGKTRKTFLARGDKPGAWGHLAIWDDLLVATSDPVELEVLPDPSKMAERLPPSFRPLVDHNEAWQYLVGSDPKSDWTTPDFRADWQTGKGGFGFDGDRPRLPSGKKGTLLGKMLGKYSRVYLRREITREEIGNASEMALLIDYDDGFIAYLNGKEVARSQVGRGQGARASSIRSHSFGKRELFLIENFQELLRPGKNVLAIEGHNVDSDDDDFWLDPSLVVNRGEPVLSLPPPQSAEEAEAALRRLMRPTDNSSASRRLVVFDRHSGRQLWSRDATLEIRHNTVALGNGKVFFIDGLSPRKLVELQRRKISQLEKARLYALDVRTGKEVWSTDRDVTGTFLSYSAEQDVLLQAGSAYRDRPWDETASGMAVYRGKDGEVIWQDPELKHGGPCLLWKDRIITNGAGGFELELFTGKPTGWEYKRMYGCNTAVGCDSLLLFRSGAAGFYDLAGRGGVGNLGGFRSGCTSNLIPADGVVNAPDYTRTCSCAYQNQCSLAFVHDPDVDLWTFGTPDPEGDRLGINLGAPGDRRDEQGTLWLEYPGVGGPSPRLAVEAKGERIEWFRQHSSAVEGPGLSWVASSGARGIRSLRIKLDEKNPQSYTVRLHFAEPDEKPGERLFSVLVQGKEAVKDLDVAAEAGGPGRSLVREVKGVTIDEALELELVPTRGAPNQDPLLCGVELIPEKP